jgi:hypothetical protein
MQNLISAIIAPEVKTRVVEKLTEIKTDLSFLITLGVDEIRVLFKAANIYSVFIDEAYNAVAVHPETMPLAPLTLRNTIRIMPLGKSFSPSIRK